MRRCHYDRVPLNEQEHEVEDSGIVGEPTLRMDSKGTEDWCTNTLDHTSRFREFTI